MGLIMDFNVRLAVTGIQVNKSHDLQLLCPKHRWCDRGASAVIEMVDGHPDMKMMAR